MNKTAPHTCLNCGNHFTGNYCNHCGEKLYAEHDKKVSHLFHEAFHFLTHFDNKFFRGLRLIFARPGFLSAAFTAGQRKKYYSPFSLFLVAVFLYLLFPNLQGLNISFSSHLRNTGAIGLHFQRAWATARAANENISMEQLAEKFDHVSPKVSKIVLIILVPLVAWSLMLLFRRSKKYFFDHFIYASEYLSFLIFYSFFLLPLLFVMCSFFFPVQQIGDGNIPFLVLQIGGCWLVAALGISRFYQLRLWKSVAVSLIFLLLLALVITVIYRTILFTVVMLFV